MSEPHEAEMRDSPEFDLIGAIRERLGATALPRSGEIAIGIGDDAAVTTGPGWARAVTVDATVDGVSFRRSWCPPRSIGRKALGSALSDLAAMGAEATEAYVWLGMPEDLPRDECLEICDGIAGLAEAERVAVLGGDLTRSPVLSLCVTAIGRASSAEAMIGRAGADVGDAICITGPLGGAAAGLMLLDHPELAEHVSDEVRDQVVARQLEPAPRLAAGRALAACGAGAMIDVSDGLGADAEHLAAASGVGIEIDLGAVPVGEGVEEVAAAAGRDPLDLVAAGGEDYELLCAVPRAAIDACTDAVRDAGADLHEIGRAGQSVGGGRVLLRLPGGRSAPASGHDHLGG